MAGVTPNGRNGISRASSRGGTGAGAASLRSSAHSGFADEPGTHSGEDPSEHTKDLLRYYSAMSSALGPMRWWPARTPFEVIVGAILTQSTSWANVERALANLSSARLLTPAAMLRVRTE